VGRRAIMWHLVGKDKPHDISQIIFRGGMTRRLPKTKMNSKAHREEEKVKQTIQ
jgi:hypothetical protein